MHIDKTKVSFASLKRDIAQKTKTIEREFMTAKNDYYIVLALDKLILMLRSELEQWYKLIGEETDKSESTVNLTIKEAAEHVAGLNTLLETFLTQREISIKNALNIQLAMIRSHMLDSPKILSEI